MHLTIEKVLKPVFTGRLLEKVEATRWDSLYKSRADFATLEKSGIQLAVVAIVIQTLWGDPEEQIDQQVSLLQEFCKQHPSWKIVSEPDEAERALKQNKKVFILSLEGAPYFNDDDVYKRIMEKHPIRIVTPIHFTDFKQIMGKPAFQGGFLGWLLDRYFTLFGHNRPITEQGMKLVNKLIAQKIWVDFSHATPGFIRYFIEKRPKNYPSLVTHSMLSKYYGTGRAIDDELLVEIAKDGGLVGLIPSNDVLKTTPIDKFNCKKNHPYIIHWNDTLIYLKPEQVMVGSDLNSPISSLPKTDDLIDCQGKSVQLGWTTAADLKGLLNLESKSAVDYFIQTWKRVRP